MNPNLLNIIQQIILSGIESGTTPDQLKRTATNAALISVMIAENFTRKDIVDEVKLSDMIARQVDLAFEWAKLISNLRTALDSEDDDIKVGGTD